MEWKSVAENESKTQLLKLRSDKGGEFTSNTFKSWLALHGVTHHTTPPRSLESNGLAERLNRTQQDKAKTIMAVGSLPVSLWAEILEATNLIRNMTPVTNLSCTPFEKWTGLKPDPSKLRVLGCKAFCQIDKSARNGKFMPVSYQELPSSSTTALPALHTECGTSKSKRSTM